MGVFKRQTCTDEVEQSTIPYNLEQISNLYLVCTASRKRDFYLKKMDQLIHGSQQRLDVDQETVRHQYKRQTSCSPDGFWLADSS
jgi:hypothetical protein